MKLNMHYLSRVSFSFLSKGGGGGGGGGAK